MTAPPNTFPPQDARVLHDVVSRVIDPRLSPFDAVSDGEIDALFASLADAPGLVLAVSGGSDSLALLLLAARWRALRDGGVPALLVASVDHGLRAAASGEAHAVAAMAERLGIPAGVLIWEGDKPQRGVQEAARAARYRLLAEAAASIGASHVITAHHRADQAETVLMRLAGGSGVGGLAAMRPDAPLPGTSVRLARPLLGLTKERLVAVTLEAGAVAVDDPANGNPRFLRARLRELARERAALGLTDERLARLAERCARAEDALATIAAARFTALARSHGERLALSADLWREPRDIVLRVLSLGVVRVAGAGDTPVSLERLERLERELAVAAARGAGLRRTLHGAVVRLVADGEIHMVREPPRRRGRGRGPEL